ncbi:MAG TPA: serine hydrolase [Gemmatimonadaceae bacterium]|jgi:CubicO group peptidase (beta-lactamase class C family)|nr:serine hydrolase [Gemmatimonadota bacterium]HNV74665.1 serine hydrolase [Gemmatimonadaceae bacterium]
MHGALSRAALGIVTLSTVSLAQRPAARGIPADFDATVARAMATFKVPGLAVAVVKNDSVIFAKGYGVRALGAPEPVTPHSLFAVGSTSKAFTVAVLQQLEQEGKLRLDDPATQYLPSLQLYDPYVTRELTVRDLVTHRSGLPTANAVWYGTPYSREEILRRLRYRKPSASFRSTWQYQNEMFLAAGQVIAAVDGRSWDDAVKARLFTPLGMRASGTSVRELATMPDVAQPHLERDGTVRRIPYRNIDNIAPAGSINSSVHDMAQWIRFQLAKGKWDGRQLLNEAAFDDARRPYMAMPSSPFSELTAPGAQLVSYGMAWMLYGWNGRTIVEHSGGIDGMTAEVALVPEERLGLVILANLSTVAPQVLQSYLLDSFFGAPKRDWTGEVSTKMAALEKAGADAMAKAERERTKDSRPTLPLSAYAGTYADSLYGDVVVREANGALQLTFLGNREARLEHWQFDTFQARWDDVILDKTMVQFFLDASGKVDRVRIGMFAGETGDFGRRPAK